MKDNFSTASDQYALFRPEYPQEMYDFLLSKVNRFGCAWDCGTGSGQVASRLVAYFEKVEASDLSARQLENARVHARIRYTVQPAEHTDYPDQCFDLITVAQAIHWFDFDQFYGEVKRTLKEDGVFAVIGYGLIRINTELDQLIDELYSEILGAYWDEERKYIDEHYQTIPFPFHEIPAVEFTHQVEWTFDHLLGYLGTWSSVKHYKAKVGKDPLELISKKLKEKWGNPERRVVSFPILLRIGKP